MYGLLTEPGERTTIFSLFGSYTGAHSWILVQINMSAVLGKIINLKEIILCLLQAETGHSTFYDPGLFKVKILSMTQTLVL